MSRLHLDIETYSECELKRAVVYAYAEHPTTEALCLCFALDDGPAELWVPPNPVILDDPEALTKCLDEVRRRHPTAVIHLGSIPKRLLEHNDQVAAHNAQFERVVLNGEAGDKINFPALDISQMICTAAKTRMHGLPGALKDAAEALDTHRKDDTARGTMLSLSKPRTGKVKRFPMSEAWEKYAHLFAYCLDDVLAERAIDSKLSDLPPDEMDVWRLDQTINDRGVLVDVPMIKIIQALIEEYQRELLAICRKLTGGVYDEWDDDWQGGLNPSQREKIAEWVRTHGYPQLLDMTADTVRSVLKDEACPDDVKIILRVYSTYGMKAVSKYQTMLDAMCADHRIRGMFLYYGAGTGRWSSLIVQLQNLFRPVIKNCDTAIETMRAGLNALREL